MAPLKKLSKKDAALQNKPWITSGILTSMKKRDIFHKDFATEKDPTKKARLGAIFKSYQNLIVTLLRKSKKKYFTDYFEEHRQNMKKTWDGIRNLINVSKKSSTNINKIIHDDETFTDNKGISQALNKYFTNIGPSIEKKIPKAKKSFNSYLGEPNPTNITLNPCDANEIKDIISSFGSGKASGPYSIPTNLLKEFSLHFSAPISIIFESTKIKYLGLLLDSRLTWKFHINELSKKLSRAIGLLYKIRTFSSKTILRSLYFGIFHSHLTYGLPVWGYAAQHLLEKIQLLQKKALRVITSSDYHAHTAPIMKQTKILSLIDQRHVMTSSLMWDLDHENLPPTISTYFVKCNTLHHHNTRHANADKLHIKKTSTKKYGLNSFQVQGSLTLNSLKDLDIYNNATSKKSFLNNLKKTLFENYQ